MSEYTQRIAREYKPMIANNTSKPDGTPDDSQRGAGCAPMPGCVVWIVFKYGYPPEFQGVFREKSRAIEACRTSDHCVCPATMDEEISQSTEDWKGAWYPGLRDDPHNVKSGGTGSERRDHE